ncbi:1855_t:CDS:2 [Dentiscutata erythropus]|uniref:Chitin synthase n=1 Tax=Dentiscutata erythropus TaxID=1348616 RepID=A0A9N9HNI0_9GLOM|nr:1855_t:CDS:2 [Dentiscutata erythropus]
MENMNVYIPEGNNPYPSIQYNYAQSTEEQSHNDYDNSSTSLNVEPEHLKHHVNLKDVKHLVLELPIPTDLLGNILRKDSKEFTHVRYTACTSEPDNFAKKGFTLRQVETSPPRPIELFIMLAMHNEDKDLLSRTFHGVVKNIAHLCTRKRSKIWGEGGWKKVVVCIVVDGRENIEKSSLAYLAALGVYQDGVTVEKVKDDAVNAHIFEYTTQISIDHSMNIKTEDSEVVPIQFFNPICVLIDVGTEPGPKSIYNLWKAFDVDPSVAGACGEIVVKKGKGRVKLLNPIVAAQNFEYKMINILDKPFESVFGYITTLPEAFSAYRYIALQSIINEDEGPLTSYFKGEINVAKMYHAGGRIFPFELVTRRGYSWLLHYVKSSRAETYVPEEVCGLINQRIRWLSGSLFASFYVITHFYYIWRSDHSFVRKLFLLIEMVFQACKFVFSWFSLGNFYLIFYILGSIFSNSQVIAIPAPWSHYVGIKIFMVLQYAFPGLMIVQFILALMYRSRRSIRRETKDEEEKLEKTGIMGTSHDVDSTYRDAIRAIRQPSFRERSITQDKHENFQRDSRSTMILLFWLFSNAALIIDGPKHAQL